jgi:hypothetical protein
MTEKIEQGAAGLFYLTDSDERAIFIAAPTEDAAKALAAQARLAIPAGLSIHGHTLHDREGGGKLLVPDPINMTPEQRKESIDRMTAHLRQHFSQ